MPLVGQKLGAVTTVLCGCAGYAGNIGSFSSTPTSRGKPSSHRAVGPSYYGLTILVANGQNFGPTPPPASIAGFTLPSSGGNISPAQYISGSNTQLTNPLRVTVGPAGSIFASNTVGYVYKFPKGSNGNVSPGSTLHVGGSSFGMVVDGSGNLWVGENGLINEYASGAHGDATPINTISGSKTGLGTPLALAFAPNGNLYVAVNATIEIFSPTASGNVAPIATISGSNTQMALPFQLAFDNSSYGNGRLLVADEFSGKILVFALGATGNASPVQAITNMQTPLGVAADSSGHIYASGGANANSVREYRAGATGNATPLINITGPNTKLGAVGQIFIANQ